MVNVPYREFYFLMDEFYLMCHQSFENTKIEENLKNYRFLRDNYLTKIVYLCWV